MLRRIYFPCGNEFLIGLPFTTLKRSFDAILRTNVRHLHRAAVNYENSRLPLLHFHARRDDCGETSSSLFSLSFNERG